MNFTTHVMFGLLAGAVFFGKPETILLVGVGSAIPDLDREYAFFSRASFREHQIHRALFHNFLFLGLLYLVNPFVALGAFLHTLLDASTTAKDRGVEWLYPFSRFVKKAANDEHGNRLETEKGEIYLYQYDPIEFTRKSDKDLKEKKANPWRRSYGPVLSGGLLDLGIFIGSFFLFIAWSVITSVSQGAVAGLSIASYHFNVMLPFLLGSAGIALNMLVGEFDRRKRKADNAKPPRAHIAAFGASSALILSALILGAFLNQNYVMILIVRMLPLILVAALIVIGSAFAAPKIYPRITAIRQHHSDSAESGKDLSADSSKDEPIIV